ncbi:hypothetical protein ACI8AC_10090 [Geodermatophilus sp. SYSU D00758]
MEYRRPRGNLPPVQAPPVPRALVAARPQGSGRNDSGVVAAQNSCEGLSGLAQQMCYAVLYGI